ncbi:rapamycin-insensitive companion of mTOR-like isoform X1 [Salvelinus fontinalis]|uniref:rapamycin-insensitive companion of mTOR-like isoform X1 n=1 Tax=Salvelinus fontinalis TaxID=8038 RepID=UPI00248663EE|nr:rapamycin-insensitive companion of mTOR-like isoform X1 [Salvelinus fontinalis]
MVVPLPPEGGGTQFKSRSQSFNTDTTTSGISSMSSSLSCETAGNPEPEPDSSDCVSLNTVVSTKTVKTLYSLSPTQAQTNHLPLSNSKSVSLFPAGYSHTLPRRAQSLKSPSMAAIKSLADCSFMYTSPRDALSYATLKKLQQQRIHPSLSHSEALASPAKDVLFTDAITMKTGSLDSRLMARRIKEKFPYAFDDICLYSEVSHLLAHCMFRLPSRRFIQELFQDVHFIPMYEEAEAILLKPPKPVGVDIDRPTES